MKYDRSIAERMREMLTRDKVCVKEGFLTALNNDLNRILCDYFELQSPAEINISLKESGEYEVNINACASRIKQFETTLDVKRY